MQPQVEELDDGSSSLSDLPIEYGIETRDSNQISLLRPYGEGTSEQTIVIVSSRRERSSILSASDIDTNGQHRLPNFGEQGCFSALSSPQGTMSKGSRSNLKRNSDFEAAVLQNGTWSNRHQKLDFGVGKKAVFSCLHNSTNRGYNETKLSNISLEEQDQNIQNQSQIVQTTLSSETE